MNPAYRENQPPPVIHAQRASTEEKNLLESTLDAYEVEELSERYLAGIDRRELAKLS